VRALQRGLNRLGSILLVDGDFGPATTDAVANAFAVLGRTGIPCADDELQTALDALPDPFPPVTAAGLSFIARAEVSGPRDYTQRFARPIWPSATSGITIGIGYDLGTVSMKQFAADWRDRLTDAHFDLLCSVVNVNGTALRLKSVRSVAIPFNDAMAVFVRQSLPSFTAAAQRVFRVPDDLPPSRLAALVSLVYNRGTRLTDTDTKRRERREMREIRDLLAAGSLDDIPDRFESMTRLWDANKLPGLIKRRRDEARLWRAGFSALQLE